MVNNALNSWSCSGVEVETWKDDSGQLGAWTTQGPALVAGDGAAACYAAEGEA
jgi:hypothetical protein